MRPFKFFFVLALAVFVFSFVAKFVIMALIVAAIFSVVFFVFRKIRDFFFHLTWDGEQHGEYADYGQRRAFAESRYQAEPLFYQNERPVKHWNSGLRTVKIH